MKVEVDIDDTGSQVCIVQLASILPVTFGCNRDNLSGCLSAVTFKDVVPTVLNGDAIPCFILVNEFLH
jgi:hypothetical protein